MKERNLGRLAAEFVVIVLGVLLALAADRWNQGRADAEAESAYLARLTEEIRTDSIEMEAVLARMPAVLAARDSLMRFVDGGEAPPDLRVTILVASIQLDLNPPNAWRELETSSSLNVLRSPEVRQAVSTYYRVARERYDRSLTRAQERGRDPFFNAVYRMGLLEPSFASDGTPITVLGDALAARPTLLNIGVFRDWPEMPQLLAALGSMYLFQSLSAGQITRNAGSALQVLEAARR